VVVIAAFLAPIVHADEAIPDHDRARAALEAGEIVSLDEILALAQAAVPGQPIEVELEREASGWIYEIEIITLDGRVVKTFWDAKTKKLLERDEDLRKQGADD